MVTARNNQNFTLVAEEYGNMLINFELQTVNLKEFYSGAVCDLL